MLLCGRIVLVARLLPVFYPRLLAHKDCALEVHKSEQPLEMDPFFPENLRGVTCLLRSGRCDLIPKIFVLFCKNRIEFRRLCILEYATQIC